jgi:hypothetical protein
MANENKDNRPTILLSGGRTTQPLGGALAEHYQLAIYDQGALGHFLTQVENVMCPANGAGEGLKSRATNEAAQLSAGVAANIKPLGERFAVPGIGAEMLGAGVNTWLPGMAMTILSSLALDLRALEAFMAQVPVVAAVTHEDVTPRFRAMVLYCKAHGVPTIHIPHANHFCHVRPDVCLSDWLLAASPWMRDWYVKRGYPVEQVRVMGCPNWDVWPKICRDISKEHARLVLKLDATAPTVMYCTSWSQNTNLIDDHTVKPRADVAMLKAAKREGWQLIIKLHPGEPPQWVQQCAELAKEHSVPAVVTKSHLHYTMRAADVVVAVGPSNVLVEAGLANRPPVAIPLRGYKFGGMPPWEAEPTVDAVASTVNMLLAKPDIWQANRSKFVKRYAHSSDGRATDRTIAAILDILTEQTT